MARFLYSRYILLFFIFTVHIKCESEENSTFYLLDELFPDTLNEKNQNRLKRKIEDRLLEDECTLLYQEPLIVSVCIVIYCKELNPRKHFIFLEELGKGGFGAVYKAERRFNITDPTNTLDGELLAIKAIPLLCNVKGEAFNFTEGFKQMTHRLNISKMEIQILKALHHQNIVHYKDCYFHNGMIYVVLEYVCDNSLHNSNFKYDVHKNRMVLNQIIDAAIYMHSEGLIHRDLKPSNILIRDDGVLKVIDFGISKNKTRHKITRGGTKGYRPPESYTLAQTNKFDIYSIGMIAHFLYFGERPKKVDEETFEIHWKPSQFKKYSVLIDFINACTAMNPDDRPTALALKDHPFLTGRNLQWKFWTITIEPCPYLTFSQKIYEAINKSNEPSSSSEEHQQHPEKNHHQQNGHRRKDSYKTRAVIMNAKSIKEPYNEKDNNVSEQVRVKEHEDL